ncbi:MAG: hydrogenase expression/formation protein HypE [Thermodesulfovibrionales bacterium]|nr:hydrogenase expression/formation protein HypE [Thermodesulfovibrionales bacterium]
MKEILLSHGGGGRETQELIRELFLKYFSNPVLNALEDSAILRVNSKIAFTTDSFTVSPPFFKGGNIGKLSIVGTVNDLSVMGAKPYYLSAGFLIEEGFPYHELEEIVKSMSDEANKACVKIVTGDTKVVPRGNVDRIFINTSGIGEVICEGLSASNLREGDAIIISGTTGDHGACIMAMREDIGFDIDMESDCRAMWDMVDMVLTNAIEVHAMRDPTRGGLSAVLNEWAAQSNITIEVEEESIPVKDPVSGLCELLGFDPFHLACEGKIVFAVSGNDKERALDIIRRHPAGKDAEAIGKVTLSSPGRVILKSSWGTRRIMEPPAGELLPRIC